MMKRPKTPEELANKGPKKMAFTLTLTRDNISYLKDRAGKAGVSLSSVVDEAVEMYIDVIRRKKD